MKILYEDNHLIAVNKKPGQITQGDKTGDLPLSELVKEFIKKRDNKPGNVFLGVIHRLDRPVSGVILFAKTSKALSRMNKQFQDKLVQKVYWALTVNSPIKKEGKLVHWLVKDTKRNTTKAHLKEIRNSKRAELDYRHLSNEDKGSLLEVYPKTGRPHQIRVQLSSMNCTIKGDLRYGAMLANGDKSICLHARKLIFKHPVSKEDITIQADILNNKYWGI